MPSIEGGAVGVMVANTLVGSGVDVGAGIIVMATAGLSGKTDAGIGDKKIINPNMIINPPATIMLIRITHPLTKLKSPRTSNLLSGW